MRAKEFDVSVDVDVVISKCFRIKKIEELRSRLDEKNRMIEKKTHQSMMGTHDHAKCCAETEELRNHVDIRERKISVLQRKVSDDDNEDGVDDDDDDDGLQ